VENFIVNQKFLTKKHIILITIIVVLVIVVALLFVLYMHKHSSAALVSNTTFTSKSGEISLTLSDKYQFSLSEKGTYEIVLKSEVSKSSIYVSKVSANNIRDKNKFIEYDKDDYISKFSNISEVSDIDVKTINGLEAYNYHFTYKDTMYVDVYWIFKDSYIYVFDFNIDTGVNDMSSHMDEIMNSLKLN